VGGLSSYAWRSLVAHRLRTLLTVVGIALGVAVLFAALATNAGIEGAIGRTVRDLIGRADLRVEGFTERGLSLASVEAIAGTPGVAVSTPILERRTYPAPDPLAPPSAALPPPITVLGIDPATYPELHDVDLAAGSAFETVDAAGALITERLAGETGLALGGSIALQGADGPRTESIVGILAGDGPLATTDGRTVVLALNEASQLFGTDAATRVDIGIGGDTSTSAVAVEIESRLTSEPYVVSGPDDLAASIRGSTVDFQATTALIAALALFGGAFLIFNTLSMTVAERAREVGLLRAAGATRRQVNGLVLTQALAIGLAGSVLGVLLGAGLAVFVAWSLRRSAVVPIDGPELTPAAVALAVIVGVVVTLAAAVEPADRAGRIPPVEALRPVGVGPAVRARLRWLVVVFVVVAIAALVVWSSTVGASGAVRWIAVYGILLGATLVTPVLLGPLGAVAALPFRLVAPGAVRLTRGALVRDRSRTTLTVGALTVGLAMIVALGGMAQDARRAATAWIAGVVPGDLIATSIRPVGFDEPVRDDLAAAPGVARVSPLAAFEVAFRGLRLDASAVVGEDLLADGRLSFVGGDRTAALNALDEGGSTVVPETAARSLGLRVGDEMAFPVGGSDEVRLRIVGIVERTIPGRTGESILVGWRDATEEFGVAGADAFAVRFGPTATAADRSGLAAVATGYALEANPVDRIAGAVDATLGRVFGLFDALALVAVLVAALGIVNTLTMNVYERVREIGVLRSAGMTRPQVWRMVVVEAGVLGVVGAILGCVTGLLAGQVMIGLAGTGGLRLPFEPDWPTILAAAAFGIAVAMLAAVWPARQAARISIVRAVQFEEPAGTATRGPGRRVRRGAVPSGSP
jgi:putative ABC transport system permease protein